MSKVRKWFLLQKCVNHFHDKCVNRFRDMYIKSCFLIMLVNCFNSVIVSMPPLQQISVVVPVQTVHTVCKLSRLSRNFPDSQETFQLKVNILEAKTFRSVKCQRSFSASAETFVRNDQRLTTHLPPKRFHNLTCELIGIMI